MCVFNNFTHDSRVLKEASSLVQKGYSVTVLARLDDHTLSRESINGITVKRLSSNPLHLKLIHLIRNISLQKLFPNHEKLQGHGKDSIAANARFSESPMRINSVMLKNLYNSTAHGVRYVASTARSGLKNALVSLLMRFNRPLVILDFNYRIVTSTPGEAYDVFHAHDLNTLMGAYVAAKKQGAKLIYDSHELYLERNRFEPYDRVGKWMRKKVEAYLIRRSDHVITVNDSLARMLADTYQVKRPTVVMNTPSLERVSPPSDFQSLRRALGIQDDQAILLYSGSITFNRGLENLIESLVYLPQCFLVLMGYSHDSYENKLRAIAREKGVASRLAFFGPVPTDEVTLYASSADVGVAPIENVCLSYYYCSPNKLFEYLLAGLPVIASDFPEMRQIIDEYGVGSTFNPSDAEDIARAAMEILEAPEKWKDMKNKTEALASAYNWEKESQKLIRIYESLP